MVSNLILSSFLPGKGGAGVAGWSGLSNGWKPDLPERGGPLGLGGCSGDG